MIKEKRTKILLIIFLMSDVNFNYVFFNSNIEKIFDISFNQKTKGILSGLIKEQLIEKNEQENQYRLTNKGFNLLCFEFPFFRFLKDTWDGRWRIISYEIPESKREIRDRLRREMEGWGLGPWHRSFWLTPHPVIEKLKDLISNKEEESYVQSFEADHVFGKKEILIEKVWKISYLDNRYREMFKRWHNILSSADEKIDKFKKIILDYVSLLKTDPGLPKELIGERWIGFEGWNIFKEIRTILLS